ncbi:MAG: HAD domain-containing protein [Nitrosarchaeum sp.]|nr:HAD domain-containing protein [Nitrosarchaeum sp.]
MTVIFLDIDGVFCTLRSHYAYNNNELLEPWDPTCCQMIRRLCLKYDLKIVCSSSWRNDPKCKSFFEKYELLEFLHDDWRTKDILRAECRGQEVAEWLTRHTDVSYIIIDDDSDFLKDQLPFFVKTAGYDGFSAHNYQQVEDIVKQYLAKLPD